MHINPENHTVGMAGLSFKEFKEDVALEDGVFNFISYNLNSIFNMCRKQISTRQ